MSNWIVITKEDLNDYLLAAQVSAIRTAARAVGQADRFEKVMPDIASRIRAKIQSCTRNQVSLTENSIPAELKWVACYLIIEALQTNIPGLDLTEDQKTQCERAVTQLDRIADCKDTVTTPSDPLQPSDVQTGGAITVVNAPTRRASRDTLSGL